MSRRHTDHILFHNRIEAFKQQFTNNNDIKYRELELDLGKACIIFVDSIIDTTYLSENIIQPLINQQNKPADLEAIKNEVLTVHDISTVKDIKEAAIYIASGNVIILFSFADEMLYCPVKKISVRSVEEPPTESVIKGPREGFNENIVDSISLVRRRLMNDDLKMEHLQIGTKKHITIVIVYIDGVAPQRLVDYVKDQIQQIQDTMILYTNHIEEQLKARDTAFDTVGYTEKPDVFASKIVEGRVGVMVDGHPFAIYVPHFFIENINMADDYYLNKFGQNYFRIIRWIGLLIGLLLPGLYVAITTHHFSLIPSIFVFRLAVLRAGVPFPTVVEVWIMMFFFQVLREAGVRLPQAIGPAISIVGALILGDAAIRSGLASEVTVLVIALSSICLFLIPKLHGPISIWTNIILLASAGLGLPGFYISFIVFCTHVAGLTSCGYPHLYPLGTFNKFGFKDIFIRGDLRKISNNILKKDEEL